MSAARVLRQLVTLIEEGRATDATVGKMLETSGIQLIVGSKTGTYKDGMLSIGGAMHGLDPAAITGAVMPEVAPAPAPAPAPKRVIDISMQDDVEFGDELS